MTGPTPPVPPPKARPLLAIFGGSGDLMHRKLLPALYALCRENAVPEGAAILGVARSSALDDGSYRAWAVDALSEANAGPRDALTAWASSTLSYHAIGDGTPADFQRLAQRIATLENAQGLSRDRIFYLALPFAAFAPTIEGIGGAGLQSGPGFRRLVVEKPFGRDLETARELNATIHRYFPEGNVFRIDHYLGKETVQNLLVFRFSNMLFESVWNRDRVESVEITVAEALGVEERAGYYDQSGALRDMVQNHLTQILALTAMDAPVAYAADPIRNEKLKVLQAIAPIEPTDAVFGQYGAGDVDGQRVPGYLEEEGVPAGSTTETFVALKLEVHNWRWHGVPFCLRTGKRLHGRSTEVRVRFREPPVTFFRSFEGAEIHPNELVITIQPNEGFDLVFEVKRPGDEVKVVTERMSFRYAESFGPLEDGYHTLLKDILDGDPTLFVRADEVEASWAVYAPLLASPPPIQRYAAGSDGPRQADELFAVASDARGR